LVGNSGGGKSSIVNLILRFYDPCSGCVRVNGVDVREFDMRALRQNIAVVTQKIAIFNENIAYNVAYSGLANGEEIDESRVIEALKAAHAWEFVSNLPQTIHTLLEESGTNLSGGQRQRIAIARVLYQNPSVLILDEATSALDNKTESNFKETLKEVIRDKITLIIAHRLSTIELADRIAFVQQGKIIAMGSYEELLQNCKEFAQLYYGTAQ
ncbi:MAG: ATP-binding cassette domain-containing protein, partial [Helicobacter sp.]|nr:ATP-binding cassette domain-containing protein [Helicobacter sp.]